MRGRRVVGMCFIRDLGITTSGSIPSIPRRTPARQSLKNRLNPVDNPLSEPDLSTAIDLKTFTGHEALYG